MKSPVHETIANDLASPIVAAAWVGLVMTVLDDQFSKKNRLVIFGMIVAAGFVYMTWKRSLPSADD